MISSLIDEKPKLMIVLCIIFVGVSAIPLTDNSDSEIPDPESSV